MDYTPLVNLLNQRTTLADGQALEVVRFLEEKGFLDKAVLREYFSLEVDGSQRQ